MYQIKDGKGKVSSKNYNNSQPLLLYTKNYTKITDKDNDILSYTRFQRLSETY